MNRQLLEEALAELEDARKYVPHDRVDNGNDVCLAIISIRNAVDRVIAALLEVEDNVLPYEGE